MGNFFVLKKKKKKKMRERIDENSLGEIYYPFSYLI